MSVTQRQRSARAISNDVTIRAVAIDEVVRVGIDRVSLREIAQRAGLTHGATYARYEDVDELLIELWKSQLMERASELVENAVRAVEVPSDEGVAAIMASVRCPTPLDVAMVEMLFVSPRMPVLYEEVQPFIKKYFQPGDDLTPAANAKFVRAASLFALSAVGIFEGYLFGVDASYLDALERVLCTTVRTRLKAVLTTSPREIETLNWKVMDGDLRAELAYSTTIAIALSGYHGATISRIARRVGCSPGAIYKIYSSKEELVQDSFTRVIASHWMKNSDFARVLDGEAVSKLLAFEASGPNALRRSFALETVIAAGHNEKLHAAISRYLKDPGGLVARLDVKDRATLDRVTHLVHSLSWLTNAVRWLASIAEAPDAYNFDHIAEPFREGLVREWRQHGART